MTNEDIDDVEGKAGGDRLSDITVDRRRFMETLGIGAAGLSGLGGTAGAQSSDEVIELEAVTVDDGEGDPEHVWKAAVLSIAESVADESAPLEQIDLDEVQQATNWWATGAEVPDTGGETIELGAVQDLINRWATGDTDGIDSINPTLSLTAGEEYTVEWTNVDGGEHNFVVADADGNELESSSTFGDQGATQTFTFTATEGMTEYYCGTHPDSQRGTIEVDGGSVERPNVVLIMADDMGYGDTSVPPFTSGEPTPTPNLEAMASNGATFTSHYNGAPVCTPSRAALLTGCYPARAGMDAHDVYFPGASNGLHPDEVTIPEVLQGQGYATGMVGKWHLGDADPFLPPNQGFDTYYGVPYSNDMTPFPLLEGVETIRDEAPNSQLTQLYTEQATQFIADHQDEPFFLYLPHTMAHVPLGVSDDFDGATDHGTYADVIHELDWSVGQILDQLESLGIEEETLVVFTTDDGPWLSYGDDAGTGGPLRGGKMSTWEGGARAPTIMHMPGTIPAGASCDEMTSHIDFLPTAASLAGADLPDATTDGEDLTEVLENPESASSPHDYLMYYGDGLEAIRNAEGWKYHFGSGNLYDLEADIDESNDVSGQNPGIADELQQQGNSFDDDLQVNARPEGSLSNIAYLSVGSSGSNGETTVTFTNNRDVTVTDVSVTASSPDDGVTVEPSSTSLGSVDPGSSVTVQVQLTSSGDSTTGESFVLAEATYTADGVTRDTEAGEHVTFVNLDPVPSQYSTFNNGSQNPVFGSKDGSLIIEGTGGVYGENDAYSTIYLDDGLPSSGTVVAKVTDVDQAMEFSTGDLVVRNDITKPGESPGYVNVSVNQVNAQIKIDENGDGNIQQTELQDFSGNGLPKWLRVQRSGTNYTASYSSDGSNWTQIAAFTLEGATDVQDVGVAVTSGTEENARVEFGEFQVSDASDIGPLPEKYSTFNNGSSDPQYGALGDTLVVEGTGKAAGDADEYTTVFLDDGLLDGATAVAKIDSVELVSQYSTGGFIVRNDATQPGSSQGYAMVSVNENGGEVKFDENANGFLDEPGSTFEVNGLPAWLKLERSGTSYTASYSADGSSWTEASTFDLENASALQDIGIAVTAPAEENTRVEFSEFEVLEPLPAEYSTFNNGSSSPEYGVSDGTLFVEGTGKAANGTDEYTTIYLDDAFSDGSTATAKVTDVEMVTDFSTADLVVRNDLTKPAESPGYASITVNDDIQESKVDADGNGIFESSEITENTSPGLPVWLRWERSGTTVTASYSTDGSTWSEITTVDLPSPTVAQDVGIAVTGPEGNQRVEIGEVTVDNGTN